MIILALSLVQPLLDYAPDAGRAEYLLVYYFVVVTSSGVRLRRYHVRCLGSIRVSLIVLVTCHLREGEVGIGISFCHVPETF